MQSPRPTTRRSDALLLLEALARGELDPQEALVRLSVAPYEDLGFARADTHRELRQGVPEAVLAEGKRTADVVAIAQRMLEAGSSHVLVTRASDEVRSAVMERIADANEDAQARVAWIEREPIEPSGTVAIVSGGTSDGPVVGEARITSQLAGTTVRVHEDVGVAGIHRLATAMDDLLKADCVVVVAGQDAALASVVGGLVAVPVIGVPTSTGYGAAFGGASALLSMLTSCAAGVAVVNIDDGFGAGTIAARIARAAARR